MLFPLQQLARVKAEVRHREEMIKEKQQFLDNEAENNNEQEKKISLAERTAARLRLDFQEAEKQRDQFQSEVQRQTLRNNMRYRAKHLEIIWGAELNTYK